MEYIYSILFVCYASYAYNRKSVAFSMPSLKEDGLDTSHAGLISSCQNTAFAISKFLAGILSDRLNPQLLFATGLFVSGFATVIFSSSSSITTFCCLWFLNGLAQGCGWPSCAKILRQRASPAQFGTLWSILTASNNVSGSLGPLLSAYVIVHYGWRWNVFLAGFISLSLCAMFLLSLPFLSDAPNTKKSSASKTPSSSKDKNDETTITDLFLDPFIWLLSIGFMIVFCARTATIDWGQMYLIEEKKQTQYVASVFISSVETGGFIGRIAAGYLTDWVIRRDALKQTARQPRPVLRMSVAIMFVLGGVLSIYLFRFAISETSSAKNVRDGILKPPKFHIVLQISVASKWLWITLVGAFMGMSYYGPVAIFGIVSSESVPSHLSGSSHAIVALFGNIGATVAGLPFSYIAKYYSWSSVFLLLEFLMIGTLLLLVWFRKKTPRVAIKEE